MVNQSISFRRIKRAWEGTDGAAHWRGRAAGELQGDIYSLWRWFLVKEAVISKDNNLNGKITSRVTSLHPLPPGGANLLSRDHHRRNWALYIQHLTSDLDPWFPLSCPSVNSQSACWLWCVPHNSTENSVANKPFPDLSKIVWSLFLSFTQALPDAFNCIL